MIGNIEQLTEKNKYFRKTIDTGDHLQLVVMNLSPRESIGMEVHDLDQLVRVEKGYALVEIGGKEYRLRHGGYVMVHAGTEHNITNISGTRPLKLYTIYSRPVHSRNCIQKKKKDREC